jgi:hypothetical protein
MSLTRHYTHTGEFSVKSAIKRAEGAYDVFKGMLDKTIAKINKEPRLSLRRYLIEELQNDLKKEKYGMSPNDE